MAAPNRGPEPVDLRAVPGEPGAVRATIDPEHTWFREHVVRGRRILPGVVWLELAFRGLDLVCPGARVHGVADGAWLRPVSGDEPVDLVLRFRVAPDGRTAGYTIDNHGLRCGLGTLQLTPQERPPSVPTAVRDRIAEDSRSHFTRREIYTEFAAMGIDYGAHFRRISYVQRLGQASLALLTGNDGIRLEPVPLLDCAFQAGMAISIGEHRDSLMPFSLGQLVVHRPPVFPLPSAFVLTEKHSPFRTGCTVYDDGYEPLLSVFDLGVKPAR
ncbi:polyketide synthase dehydratase domain-containing protein [Amycolatopsis sp. lyj-346]|uniref:polyketide synthase dehydratase domain-containing protein n=1 Tax=Amycolatopsis sp. lyj-346 TaxID=2789289 RepID=UPI00397E2D28